LLKEEKERRELAEIQKRAMELNRKKKQDEDAK
jgi:hypothetical protein